MNKTQYFEKILYIIYAYSMMSSVFGLPHLIVPMSIFCCLLFSLFFHRHNKPLLVSVFILIISSLLIHDTNAVLDLFFFSFGLMALYQYANRSKFDIDIIYRIYLYIYIPTFIFSYLLGPMSSIGVNLAYLPLAQNGYKINIIAWSHTGHGTAAIGLFLYIASVYNMFIKENVSKIRLLDRFMFLLSLYFMLFSGARGVYVSVVVSMFALLLNRRRVRYWLSITCMVATVVFCYAIDYFSIYLSKINNPILRTLTKADNVDNSYNITSGRMWLWDYHLNKFTESSFLGDGSTELLFTVGDVLKSGEIAVAGSESPATYLIACYGVIGIVILSAYWWMFTQAAKNKNLLGLFIMFALIPAYCSSGVNFFSLKSPNSFLILLIFFMSQKLAKNKYRIIQNKSIIESN